NLMPCIARRGLAEPERRDEQAAIAGREQSVTAVICDDLQAEELAAELGAVPGDVDHELALVVAEDAAVARTQKLGVSLEDPLVHVDAVRISGDQRVRERIRVLHD